MEKIGKIRNNAQTEIAYYLDGKVLSKSLCIDGVTCGVHFNWQESGIKNWQTSFKGRQKHGLNIIWRKDGSRWLEEMYKDDKQHGHETRWYRGGMKHYITIWGDNQKHGVETEWHTDGNKNVEIYYVQGNKYAQIYWDEKGNVTETNFPTNSPQKSQKQSKTPNQENHIFRQTS